MSRVVGVAVLGAIVVIGGAWFATTRPHDEQPPVASPSPITPAASSSVPASVIHAETGARPVPPVYTSRPAEPAAIYRCGSGSGTTYTQTPCDGGRVVEPSGAVSGFDSRPSPKLEKMVEDGRRYAPPPPELTTRVAQSTPPPTRRCALMARQIRDIDATTLQPMDLRELDEWRKRRQDIRTSMAREHC